jgi:hypothetical protein
VSGGPVPQKLHTTEGRQQDQICFRKEITGTNVPNQTVLGLNPNEDVFCSSETKQTEEHGIEQNSLLSQGYYRN